MNLKEIKKTKTWLMEMLDEYKDKPEFKDELLKLCKENKEIEILKIDKLIQRVKELEAENKDWKFKASCHVSQCIADYEDLEKRIKELEEGIRKYLAGWDKHHPNRNIYVLEKLIE